LHRHGSAEERQAHAAAVDAFRLLIPAAFTVQDPTPYRTVMFAIQPIEVSGRAASTSA
jgi:hypothetical protein